MAEFHYQPSKYSKPHPSNHDNHLQRNKVSTTHFLNETSGDVPEPSGIIYREPETCEHPIIGRNRCDSSIEPPMQIFVLSRQPQGGHELVPPDREIKLTSKSTAAVHPDNKCGRSWFIQRVPTKKPHENPSEYLESFYDAMYFVGVSAYHPKNGKYKCVTTGRDVKALFWCVTVLSLSHSIFQAKYNLLNFLSGKGYSTFVDFAFYGSRFGTKMLAIGIFALKQQETDEMLTAIKDYSHNVHNDTASVKMFWNKKISWIICMSTLLIVASRTFASVGTSGTSIKQSLLMNSMELSEDIFNWNSNATESEFDQLELNYGTNLTATSALFGGVVFLRNFASHLQLGILQDLILIVAWVTYTVVMDFIKELKGSLENAPPNDNKAKTDLQARREVMWVKYRRLKNMFTAVNNVYDSILKLMHVGNLLMYAVFMTLCLFNKPTSMQIVFSAMSLVKAEIAYYLAGEMAEQNAVIRTWIRNWALHTGKISVNSVVMDVNVLLDELEQEPIGLGKSTFLIQQTFHFKMLGLVGSTCLSLADEYKKSQ